MGLFWGEKEGAVKGSRIEQMKAVESWALECYQESKKDNPNLDEILENLRKINLQVRKIWSNTNRRRSRSAKGKPIGIPSGPRARAERYDVITAPLSSDWMKKKITEIRAAAVVTLRDIKKDNGLSNNSKKTIRLMSSWATEIAEKEAISEAKYQKEFGHGTSGY